MSEGVVGGGGGPPPPPPTAAASTKPTKKKRRNRQKPGVSFIDLTGVPPQPPILKNALSANNYKDNTRRHPVKEGSSKYTGVYYDKAAGKWKAQIMVDCHVRSIGYYETEEGAAADYARAAYKYKPKKASEDGYTLYGGLDLSNVPEQPLIRSSARSGYLGVKKMKGRWQASIGMGTGKYPKTLGTFDTVEEAAGIYARAAYYLKSRGENGGGDNAKSEDRKGRSGSNGTNDERTDGESNAVNVAILVGESGDAPAETTLLDDDDGSGDIVAV